MGPPEDDEDADDASDIDDYLTAASEQMIKDQEWIRYRDHMKKHLIWLRERGKNPQNHEGYADKTIKRRMPRVDKFFRWFWDEEGFDVRPGQENAEDYIDEMRRHSPAANSLNNTVKALKSYFRWREAAFDEESWDYDYTYRSPDRSPYDTFTRDERPAILDASVAIEEPPWDELDSEQREEEKRRLAQRLGTPMETIGEDIWRQYSAPRISSLLHVTFDAGLRPVEIEDMTTSWVDPHSGRMTIPCDDSVKNKDHWKVALRDETQVLLTTWLEHREKIPMYDDTDLIWLNEAGNPYKPPTLNALLDRVLEEANIDTGNRRITWYSIRHTIGTLLSQDMSLKAAGEQLRHKSKSTTMRYDQPSREERKDGLEDL